MAKKLDPMLLDIFKKYDENAQDCLWDCHGTWVAYHKALERIATKAGVRFDQPTIVQADGASKIVSIVVTGWHGEKSEWSFGEASPANNKNAYPYAMAEKRAKDRVILKLIGLHGFVYSEEESDDFKVDSAAKPKSSAQLKRDGVWETFTDAVSDCRNLVELESLKKEYRDKAKAEGWNQTFTNAMADEFLSAEKAINEANEAAEAAGNLRMAG